MVNSHEAGPSSVNRFDLPLPTRTKNPLFAFTGPVFHSEL